MLAGLQAREGISPHWKNRQKLNFYWSEGGVGALTMFCVAFLARWHYLYICHGDRKSPSRVPDRIRNLRYILKARLQTSNLPPNSPHPPPKPPLPPLYFLFLKNPIHLFFLQSSSQFRQLLSQVRACVNGTQSCESSLWDDTPFGVGGW